MLLPMTSGSCTGTPAIGIPTVITDALLIKIRRITYSGVGFKIPTVMAHAFGRKKNSMVMLGTVLRARNKRKGGIPTPSAIGLKAKRT